MIHEEICTYEVCKLAKEKGFNKYEACNHIYEDDEQWRILSPYTNAKGIDWSKDKFTVAPTQSLLQRWLREEKGIEIKIRPIFISGVWLFPCRVYAPNLNKPKKLYYYYAYTYALEAALKYALENLV